MRELGAEASMIGRDLDRSRQLWERVAPTPPGMAIDWPSDLLELATELGLEPDRRVLAAPVDHHDRMARRDSVSPPYRAANAPPRPPTLEAARALRDVVARGETPPSTAPRRAVEEMTAIYRALAAAGDPVACRELAECYARGVGDPRTGLQRNVVEAGRLRRLGAAAGDRECILAIVEDELSRGGDEGKHAQLLAPLLPDDADGRAHLLAGHMAHLGRGVPMDRARSLELYARAAELGNVDAMFDLYALLSDSRGPRDEQAALAWCVRAAELGHPRACYNLGAFHAKGRGLPQDWEAARKWYERGAELGSGRAAATLAAMYETGEGVPADAARAAQWRARAAASDDPFLILSGTPEG